jgi:uncharacterized Zn finger protein
MATRTTPLDGNWWARRWMAALDGFGWSGRLARGRSYARGGRVLDIEISPGLVRARVQGSQSVPYRIEMGVETFEEAVWDRVIGALARQAIYVAKMLAGELPAEVVELCRVAEASLFPDHPDEIRMSCSCPDWAVPCKHVAAVHYALAAELDRDPFLLFRLRGRTREELTSALRARRVGLGGSPAPSGADVSGAPDDADDDADALTSHTISVDRFWQTGPELDDLHFEIRSPEVPGAVLRLLGPPPAWGSHEDLLSQLLDLYRIASASVRDAALADVGEADDAALDDER